MVDRTQLEQAIAVQESLRGTIDDAIIDATIAALRAQLATLNLPTAPESRRAQATLLFIDLANHTTLIQGRDPEEIMDLIDGALRRLAAPVEQHGGRIVRYQGDGYKAIFGLPVAREHDPDHAALAALEILETAAVIAAELETERGLPGFQVRVGIDTGVVLIGGGTEGEDAVTGLPVNLAARLESAAEPGTILISHHTYRHIRGVFDFQPLDPIQAKGFAEPVPVYRVLRRKARSFRTRRRGVEGVDTRMIGRDAELAVLQGLFQQMLDKHDRVSAIIVGEAGLGKSRLLFEFEHWADLDPTSTQLFRGRAWLETQNLPYGLLRSIFVFRAGILDDDPAQVVRDKLVAVFHGVLGRDEETTRKAHIVGHLLGYDFSDDASVRSLADDVHQLHNQALFYLSTFFKAAADRSPVLILLEDLHWADTSSLDAIASLSTALAMRPAMILGTARPTIFERHPDWMNDRPYHRRIDLSFLDARASDELVAEILQKVERVPDQLREMITGRAEGNPYYVEELIKMLFDEGVIVVDDERWTIQSGKLTAVHVPATLTGVLQARLDSLPTAERAALQHASIIGRHFWDAAVDYIDQASDGKETFATLWPTLCRRELVYRREESAFEGTSEFVFQHALLRDVTYQSVLRLLRRDYHRLAAEWLIKAGGSRVDEYAGQIAAHYALAEDARNEAQWQARAGRGAVVRHAAPEAIRALSRALELIAKDDPERYELLKLRRQTYHLLGEREPEMADLAEMEQIAKSSGDLYRRAEVTIECVHTFHITGAYEQAASLSAEGLRLAEEAGDIPLQAQALLHRGNATMFLGDFDEARGYLEQALELADSVQARRVQMEAVRALGVIAEEQGDFSTQQYRYHQALDIARELGDRLGERRALNSLGVATQARCDFKASTQYFADSLAIARAIGDRAGEGVVLGNMGVQANLLGRYDLARGLFEESINVARDINDQAGVDINLLNLGGVMIWLNQSDEALKLFEEGLRGARATGYRPLEGFLLNGIGVALLWNDRSREAIVLLRQAIALRLELGQPHLVAESRAFLAQALAAEGDLAAAVAEADAVLDFLVDGRMEETEELLRMLLAIYRVLDEAGDPRAPAVLARARDELQTSAGTLDDDSRQSYLGNISWNREILSLWAERAGR